MKRITGRVVDGKGNALKNFAHVKELIASRAGFPSLADGTLNIELDKHEPLTAVTAVITNEEYRHEEECIKLRRCRVKRADQQTEGLRAVIIRPSQHEDPKRRHWKRLELMSEHHIRRTLNLAAGDWVTIEFEGERETEDAWWNAAERIV